MAECIEREALLQDIEETVCFTVKAGTISNEMRGANKIVDRIKCAPAVDVVPVVHGHWDVNGRCTACGGHAPFWCMASTYYKSPFCHECGAKMDEEGKT